MRRRFHLAFGPIGPASPKHIHHHQEFFTVQLNLDTTQECPFTITALDAAGVAVPVDALTVTCDTETVATATIDATGAGMIVAAGEGTANVTVVDTATNGTAVALVFEVVVTVPVPVADPVASLELVFGTPVEITPVV